MIKNSFLILVMLLVLSTPAMAGKLKVDRNLANATREGTVVTVYDADTMTVVFDLGFNVSIIEKVRLYGIDTPELRTRNLEEKKLGYIAREFAEIELLNKTFKFQVYKKGKFGRYLVDIYLEDGRMFNQLLIDEDLALEYYGDKKYDNWFDGLKIQKEKRING